MYPKLLEIGRFFIPTYGLLVAIGVFSALFTARLRAAKDGLDGQHVFDLGLSIVIASLVGSKLTLVILSPGEYLTSFSSLVLLLRSGGVFYGGFIAGVLVAWYLLKRYRLPLWKVADTYGLALPLGQAVGRIGCFMAGCCWGRSCDLPWAVTFSKESAHNITGVPLHDAMHPTQLYHSLSDLCLFLFMLFLFKRRKFEGQIFWTYALCYAFIRFTIEFFRGDPRGFPLGGPLSTSQCVALGMILLSIVFLLRGYCKVRRSGSLPES